MDPIIIQLGPLALRWYGFLIALGVLIGSSWALFEAKKRNLDTEKLQDMTLWLVLAGLIGARLVYVLTSPAAYFGPDGNPLSAVAIWQGGGSIHGGILGIFVAVWIYSRIHNLNMWAYLDVLTPVGALGVIGGRIGNFMNGTDTTGRVTGWPVGFTWPEPGTQTFGAVGRFMFSENLWANSPQVLVNEQLAYGPVHLTQIYGVFIGIGLVFILFWAFRRSRAPGFVWWQFLLWYSVLRSVFEETFRDNPIFWNVYHSEGINAPGIGAFTLTQLVSIPLILISLYMLLTQHSPEEATRHRPVEELPKAT